MSDDHHEHLELLHLEQILPDHKITTYTLTPLTKPGENYGSTMAAVTVVLADTDEPLELVAKMVPRSEFNQRMFNTPVTMVKEIELYRTIVPCLVDFQREFGADVLDVFPEYHGGRLGLEMDARVVDDGGVFVLENLKVAGYVLGDRLVGFGLEESELVVRKLSELHAVVIALKVLRRKVFDEKVLGYLNRATLDIENDKKFLENSRKAILSSLKKTDLFLYKTAYKYLSPEVPFSFYNSEFGREPFATLVHNDFWVNNMLIKYNEKSQPEALKIVDYQITDYSSPLKDLIFFIFTSTTTKVVENHLNELIEIYYTNFKSVLQKFGVYTDNNFGREKFEDELKIEAKGQLEHILGMLMPILTKPEMAKRMDEISPDDEFDVSVLADNYDEKIAVVVREMAKRDWI